MTRGTKVSFAIVVFLLGGATAAAAHQAQAGATVEIVEFDYRPGSVTIQTGETVVWNQNGEQPHTVTADDGSFDSGNLAPGETFSMRFDSPGTYRYHCTLHGGPGGEGMSAVVLVQGDGSEEPPSVDAGDEGEGDAGNGAGEDPSAEETPPASAGASLPRTGGEPPAPWVFALALVLSGAVLWSVAAVAERGDYV